MNSYLKKLGLIVTFCVAPAIAMNTELINVDLIIEAIKNGDLEKLKDILQGYGDDTIKKSISQASGSGSTPLTWASIKFTRPDLLKFLLEKGADINARDEGADGDTPLIAVIRFGIMSFRDEVDEEEIEEHISLKLERVKLLLENGANVNGTDKNGKTPLMRAASTGDYAICKLLVEWGAHVNAVDHKGNTTMKYALVGGDERVVKLLLENGVNVNGILDKDETTPLIYASFKGNEKIVKLLLENDAEVNVWDKEYRTPLIIAANNLSIPIVKLLLENKADVNLSPKMGNSPLLFAAMHGSLELTQLLLQKGALPNTITTKGFSPLFVSVARNIIVESVVESLLQYGADVNYVKQDDKTPLFAAIGKNNKKLVGLFIYLGARITQKIKDAVKQNADATIKELIIDGKKVSKCFDEDTINKFHKLRKENNINKISHQFDFTGFLSDFDIDM